MGRAELLQAISKAIDSGLSGAENHAEEALLEEALRWERQAVLLVEELLAEVYFAFNSLEFIELDAYHHVHRGAASDRSYTADSAEARESGLGRGRQLLLHRFEVTVGHL